MKHFNCCLFIVFLHLSALNNSHAISSLEDLGLSKNHIVDLLRVCFSDSLDCKIFSKNINGKTQIITLIGESHDQNQDTYNLGLNLLRHYSAVGQETGFMNYFVENVPDFAIRAGKNFLAWRNNREAYSYSLGVFDGKFPDKNTTTIINLEAGFTSKYPLQRSVINILKGASIIIGGSAVIGCGMVLGAYMGESCGVDTIGAGICAFGATRLTLGTLQALIFKHDEEAAHILSAELRFRDQNMARNLISALNTQTSIIGTMGAAHVYGVSRLLWKMDLLIMTWISYLNMKTVLIIKILQAYFITPKYVIQLILNIRDLKVSLVFISK
jgi:hypothetical protein